MKSTSFHFTTATVCILLLHTAKNNEIPIVEIQARVDVNACASAEVLRENLQMLRANVLSSFYDGVRHCGDGYWQRVAFLNMSDPLQQCPSKWKEYNDITSGVRACGRFDIGCPGVFYSTGGRQYNKVCGRIIGYQVASPGAFHTIYLAVPPSNINDIYVDGVSVTYGSPRTHIWTLAAGVTEGTHGLPDCPCSVAPGRSPPDYVGNNYYCESGNPNPMGGFIHGHLYGDDQLWDGEMCEGQCCSNGKSPPWFSVQLANHTTQDIEVRICGDQNTYDEDNPITLLEIFVQ